MAKVGDIYYYVDSSGANLEHQSDGVTVYKGYLDNGENEYEKGLYFYKSDVLFAAGRNLKPVGPLKQRGPHKERQKYDDSGYWTYHDKLEDAMRVCLDELFEHRWWKKK